MSEDDQFLKCRGRSARNGTVVCALTYRLNAILCAFKAQVVVIYVVKERPADGSGGNASASMARTQRTALSVWSGYEWRRVKGQHFFPPALELCFMLSIPSFVHTFNYFMVTNTWPGCHLIQMWFFRIIIFYIVSMGFIWDGQFEFNEQSNHVFFFFFFWR